ncbi:MAG: formimidoyltetrahydrofolate cyclodeaminase [Micromonosporaceae bacterium]|nr:formimidoyltetrahydrofolate cyclodeaminase [Micromonosporaceae bacterium]
MRELPLAEFLERLAARVPAPGGGAVAALHAAQAAALLGMVARYTDGPRYAPHRELVDQVRAEADAVRAEALALAEADATAFAAVAEAYRLPNGTDPERADRAAAIATALAGAAEPPAAVVAVADRLIRLAERLLPVGNPNVVTDVAAAAEAARAAATTARINVEVNLGGVRDASTRDRLRAAVAAVDPLVARAERVTEAVRAKLARAAG